MTALEDLFASHPTLEAVRGATVGAFTLLADCVASGARSTCAGTAAAPPMPSTLSASS